MTNNTETISSVKGEELEPMQELSPKLMMATINRYLAVREALRIILEEDTSILSEEDKDFLYTRFKHNVMYPNYDTQDGYQHKLGTPGRKVQLEVHPDQQSCAEVEKIDGRAWPRAIRAIHYSTPKDRAYLMDLIGKDIEGSNIDTSIIIDLTTRLLEDLKRLSPKLYNSLGIYDVHDFISQVDLKGFYLIAITAPQILSYRAEHGSDIDIAIDTALKSLGMWFIIKSISHADGLGTINLLELGVPTIPLLRTLWDYYKSGTRDSHEIANLAILLRIQNRTSLAETDI